MFRAGGLAKARAGIPEPPRWFRSKAQLTVTRYGSPGLSLKPDRASVIMARGVVISAARDQGRTSSPSRMHRFFDAWIGSLCADTLMVSFNSLMSGEISLLFEINSCF